jgi:hypothetical protein
LRELLSELKTAWRTGKVELPMGKPWFRVVGRGVEPVTQEGWFAFYAIITWVTGGTYFLVTGRDPLGLNVGGVPLQVAALVAFIVCSLICILKTDFSRR